MSDAEIGQITPSATEVYDRFFLPALFEPWAQVVCDAARIAEGDTVLDVACGTGVLAIEALRRSGPTGRVTGLDLNAGMLARARTKSASVVWREGPAEDLPFESKSFDRVVSQFGLMFFSDQVRALAEMWRVLRPGGSLAVAVWASLDETPGYTAMVELLDRLFGAEAADTLRAPYSLGNPVELARLFEAAGIESAAVEHREGEAVFPSIADWVHTDIRGWTLADTIDDGKFDRLLDAAQPELQRFVRTDGRVVFPHPALIVRATRLA